MGIIFMKRVKDHSSSLLIFGVVLIVAVSAILLISAQLRTTTLLYLGNGIFDAEIVKTQAAREKGLGGVTEMGPRKAMIFAFQTDGLWAIHMKDMNVPIDIVWLDKDKKVVYSVKNVSHEDQTAEFTPTVPARYVVELPVGTIEKQHIRTGTAGVFDINEAEIK